MPIERSPNEPLDAFYARVIIALAKTAGGELRLKEDAIESDTKQLLVRDFDPRTNEIVFRVGSRYAEAAWVEPRQSAWTIPFAERQAQIEARDRGHIPTDEELTEKERLQRQRTPIRTTRPIAPTPSA